MFEKVLSGEKKFEVRLADMKANLGDVLVLKENDFKTKELTGREIRKRISFMLKTKDFPYWKEKEIEKYGYLVMQLEDV